MSSGGSGVVVEIGETTIGKRKSETVGRRPTVDKWVIGMIEVPDERVVGDGGVVMTTTTMSTSGEWNDEEEENELEDDDEEVSTDGRFRVEVCPDNVRDEMTLVGLIRKYVREGSSIMTDCWHESYGPLESYGYNRVPLNQRQWQTIDNRLRSLKKSLCRGGITEDNLPDHLSELMWRTEMDRIKQDRFLGFIQCTVEVYNLY